MFLVGIVNMVGDSMFPSDLPLHATYLTPGLKTVSTVGSWYKTGKYLSTIFLMLLKSWLNGVEKVIMLVPVSPLFQMTKKGVDIYFYF